VVRLNAALIDPGDYVYGGPTCQQLGLSCEDSHEHEVNTMADSFVPGSFAYAPFGNETFWPAIVDFCPDGDSQFVIFHSGGRRCCQPYAYYVTFIRAANKEMYGGWFTTDVIFPYDSMVRPTHDLGINLNNQEFDNAWQRANRYYPRTLQERLERLSFVNLELLKKQRKNSRKRSLAEAFTKRARRLSRGLLRGLTPAMYSRFKTEESGKAVSANSAASALSAAGVPSCSRSPPRSFSHLLARKRPAARSSMTSEDVPGAGEGFGLSPLSTQHVHRPSSSQVEFVRSQPAAELAIENGSSELFRFNTSEIVTHAVQQRAAINALVRSGQQRARYFRNED